MAKHSGVLRANARGKSVTIEMHHLMPHRRDIRFLVEGGLEGRGIKGSARACALIGLEEGIYCGLLEEPVAGEVSLDGGKAVSAVAGKESFE